ncbi:hypothetical protein D3C85_956920 [compost metagenome]
MSAISFVLPGSREVVGSAPIVDWWSVAQQLQPCIMQMQDPAAQAKMQELMRLGNDFRNPPSHVLLTELDLVEWYGICGRAMYTLTRKVTEDVDAVLRNPFHPKDSFDITRTFAFRDMGPMVELMALVLTLIEQRSSIEAQEVRIPNLKVV